MDHVEPPAWPDGAATVHLGTSAVVLPRGWAVNRMLRLGAGAALDVQVADTRFAALVAADGSVTRLKGLVPPLAADESGAFLAGVVSGEGRGRGLAVYDVAQRRVRAQTPDLPAATPRAVLGDGTVLASVVEGDEESARSWSWAPGSTPRRLPVTGRVSGAAAGRLLVDDGGGWSLADGAGVRQRRLPELGAGGAVARLSSGGRAAVVDGRSLRVVTGAEVTLLRLPFPVTTLRWVGEDTLLAWDETAFERSYLACRPASGTCSPYSFPGRGASVVSE
ncbi:MAG: hypothetical protein U0Q15_08605 [Kineosporiaceae bacterium]